MPQLRGGGGGAEFRRWLMGGRAGGCDGSKASHSILLRKWAGAV